ncbi:DUF2637 domain-containing protein (plasmid) [Mycolicibacterium fluoranthenivorans]|uniref:DUF2637 domain-containing protein n=1 Tax=Mycolicibacterium fluoranthenivorans TaxID=258505 RepID=A0A7G8PQF5_9MYCO|nr:DUF2637 domain-containing protein [Mycolicibacterium fluoranthenivorans]QNJ96571.1 DUF2637 domain-containing protein [Mycolicibacterium fluoranthenivorans]
MTLLDEAPRNGADIAAPTTHQPAPPTAAAPTAAAEEPAQPVTDPTPKQTTEEVRADTARRHALWFFWMWLLFATVVSIGGNVIHAWMTAPSPHLKLLAAVAAAVPPAVLLGSTHSVALLIKTRRRGYRRVDALVLGAALALTIGVAACAFAMSFFSLRDLMVMVGMSISTAWLWPIAVDLSLICSTLALLSLTSPQNEAAARAGAVFVGLNQPAAGVGADVGEVTAAGVVNTGPTSPAERRVWWESIAAVVREQNGNVRKIADMTNGDLAEVLERLFDNRESGRVISDSTPLHHREIKAIKDTAEGVLARTAAPVIN